MEVTHTIAARSIGERIRQARKSRGLSQLDLAHRIGVTQPAIANWESGVHDPRRITLAKLADALDAPLDWLAAGDRSANESDKAAAAAYIRRPVRHVPVISLRAAALLARDTSADPHAWAEDYIPVTLGPAKLFAVFVNDPAVDLAFLPDTLVVIDYEDREPDDGDFCLALINDAPVLRRWRGGRGPGAGSIGEGRQADNSILRGAGRLAGAASHAGPARLEPHSSEAGGPVIAVTPAITIIGCVRVSIRVH